nr:FAD binding domain-containing protein [uncultured Blautia sp.]
MKYQDYITVSSLQEALEQLGKYGKDAVIVAGATDLAVKARTKDWYESKYLVDISRIQELKGIQEEQGKIIVGAMTTISELLHSELLQKEAGILYQACGNIAGPQIRNQATIGGNLANSCLAADTIPALCVLGVTVRIMGQSGTREIPAEELLKACPPCLRHEEMSVGGCFYGMPAGKKNTLKPEEVITQVVIPPMEQDYRYSFQKIGRKKSGCMSRFTLAAAMKLSKDQKIEDLRISIGAALADIRLQQEVTEPLKGHKPDRELFHTCMAQLGEKIRSQVRKVDENIEYKATVCERLGTRTLSELAFLE